MSFANVTGFGAVSAAIAIPENVTATPTAVRMPRHIVDPSIACFFKLKFFLNLFFVQQRRFPQDNRAFPAYFTATLILCTASSSPSLATACIQYIPGAEKVAIVLLSA